MVYSHAILVLRKTNKRILYIKEARKKMTRDEAIEKAKKLLRLATSDNVHEAALAAQRAQEILDRFELTSAMLDAETQEETIEDSSVKGDFLDRCKGKQLQTWKAYLSAVIAGANGCRTFVRWEWNHAQNRQVATLHIVGRPGDAAKVRHLYMFLAHEVERLCLRDGRGNGKTWRNQYRLGVVDTIKGILKKGQEQTVKSMKSEYENNPMALVKLDQAIAKLEHKQAEVDSWMDNNRDMKTRSAPRVYSDPGAREHGRKAGREINLTAGSRLINAAKKMIS
jgi:hypothetical protein